MQLKTKNKSNETKVTIEQITALVEETKVFLETLMGRPLFVEMLQGEIKDQPLWRISKEKNSRVIICTMYFPVNKELGFWCTHENCTPGKYSEYPELKQKVQELAQALGLELKDLNKPRRPR